MGSVKQRELSGEKLTRYTVALPASLYEELRKYAFDSKESIAKVIQESIEEYLERHKETDKKKYKLKK